VSRGHINNTLKNAYALLCKVYTNKTVEYDDEDNSLENYTIDSNLQSINYPVKTNGVKRKFKVTKLPQVSRSFTIQQEMIESERTCECKQNQYEWFMFNKNLIVPEFIIDIGYIQKSQSNDQTQLNSPFDEETIKNMNFNLLNQNSKDDQKDDNENDEFQKSLPNFNHLLKDEINLQLTKMNKQKITIETLTELNLHNSNLQALDGDVLKDCSNLIKLTLSFNKLESIKEISLVKKLEYLDVSHNLICNLNGFQVSNHYYYSIL
jgi:hypothetical protein